MKDKYFGHLKKLQPRGIQSTIMIAFSLISIFLILILGAVMYMRFSTLSRQETIQSTKMLMEQTGENLEDYLVSMRQISDTVYYNVIKENDFSGRDQEIQAGMNLLYEANHSNLQSIAVYDNFGELMAAEPVEAQKKNPDVTGQAWYSQAMEEMENMHFSTPHIQNLFDDGTYRYYWVISLSRVVEITDNGVSRLGVLLVDMDYSSISRMMKKINTLTNGQYYYLCDGNGEIIYHPRQIQISDGISSENSREAAKHKDGVFRETFEGKKRQIVVNTISYTGWKLVSVIPDDTVTQGITDIRYFSLMLMLLMAMMMVIINRVISVRISRPVLRLNTSVKKYEAGGKPEIFIGGSLEIRQLGTSIQKSYEQIDTLMKKIITEQTERRKSELDALQSQINPHFLYNALESITWMIEGEKNEEAVFMISQLAKLFRISLSKGHTVISIKDELQHAQSYMNIQQVRYKNTFCVSFEEDPAIYDYCTVKLILQPILENAINYGVDGMDDTGAITVRGRLEDNKIILSVSDNGMGMLPEQAELILTGSSCARKHGSGVGLVNINNRIQILFGPEYGLVVESEPDVGTTVSVCLPAVPFTEENRKILEQGYVLREGASSGETGVKKNEE